MRILLKKHKSVEIALRADFLKEAPAAEAMAQLFAGQKDIMFSVKNEDGRYLCANKAFLVRVGLAEEKEIVGRTTREVFPAALAMNFEKQDIEVFRERKSIFNRLEVVTNPDRSLGWYITDKVPVWNHRRRIIAVASTTRDLKIRAEDDSEMAQIVNFVNMMRDQFSENVRISDLAADSGMTLSKLERRMRAIMSVAPRQLLTRIRVEAAGELLRSTDKRLSDIAYDCGFCDQPTFCRQFKSLTGMTAGQYRRADRHHHEIAA